MGRGYGVPPPRTWGWDVVMGFHHGEQSDGMWLWGSTMENRVMGRGYGVPPPGT